MKSSQDSLIGKNVDHFRLDEYIAKGAMGMVFKARDTTLERTVALKLISKHENLTFATAEARKRLIQEAKAAGGLTHPNIVTVHSYGDTEEFLYICMEYVAGKTLAEVLDERTVLEVEDALSIFEQILQALDVASREGIVHRDIKPSNIIINPEGKVKVMDFGIAKLPSLSMTSTGTILGTPYYMSPEQISGQKVDTRSDVFSVGAVLYQSLTGVRPFEGENTVAMAYKIINSEPVPANVLNVRTPASFVDVIRKALAKDPAQRFQTPFEMLQALKAAGQTPLVSNSASDGPTMVAAGPDATVIDNRHTMPTTITHLQKPGMEETQKSAESDDSLEQTVLGAPPSFPAARDTKTAELSFEEPSKKAEPAPLDSKKKKFPLIAAALVLVALVATGVFVSKFFMGGTSEDKKPLPVSVAPEKDRTKAPLQPSAGTGSNVAGGSPAALSVAELLAQAEKQMQTDPKAVSSLLHEVVAREPNNLEAKLKLARLAQSQKDLPAAIRYYEEAIRADGQSLQAYCALGPLFMEKQDYLQAIKNLEYCRTLSPPDKDRVLTDLGICYLKQGDTALAQQFFKQALDLNPANDLARTHLSSFTPATVSKPPAAPLTPVVVESPSVPQAPLDQSATSKGPSDVSVTINTPDSKATTSVPGPQAPSSAPAIKAPASPTVNKTEQVIINFGPK